MLSDLEAFLRYVTLAAVRFYLITYLLWSPIQVLTQVDVPKSITPCS